ncbi:lipase [Frankia gtarii]|uniref:lipase n=1 Tax=Frankia gtarii TaxID=2950102 RepID=UPI0021C11367|nr:lipase [Frankia gtarii]
MRSRDETIIAPGRSPECSPPRRRRTAALAFTALAVTAAGILGSAAAPATAFVDAAAAPATAFVDAAAAPLPTAGAAGAADRGGVVTAERLDVLSAAQVRAVLTAAGFDADPAILRLGVVSYRLVYRTIDPHGLPTTASGLLALPATDARRLRVVSYTHGTETARADAPSTATDLAADGWGQAPALTYAAAGFAAAAPDYLGLGVGPGPHPWMDVPSEVTASLDLLRATRLFLATQGRTVDPRILVTGFSQGASAATGLATALRSGADPALRLGALAPVSGAYDLRSVELPALLDGRVEWPYGVGYTAYLLVAFNRLHHLYDTPAEVFRDPSVEALFDGEHSGERFVAGLPASIDALLTPRGAELVHHPRGRFAAALAVADATCATPPGPQPPPVPVRLYVGGADTQVPRANSEHCRTALRGHGIDAPIVDLGAGVDHLGSNRAGTAAVVRWLLTPGGPR